ncbi:hypothetical protein MUP77_25145 [Candidatus Bathyarchaeota archaeon]|nr:hypothetical protein [Candidatus Bathyarchaeota archaeon]
MPVFGNTNIETAEYSHGANLYHAIRLTLPENGYLTEFAAYLASWVNGPSIVAVYDANGNWLTTSPTVIDLNSTWALRQYVFDLSLVAGDYIFLIASAVNIRYRYIADTVANHKTVATVYPEIPTTIDPAMVFTTMMSAYGTYEAGTPPTQYQLQIVTTVGGQTNPQANTYVVDAGTNIEVSAIPNSGYTFDHWELDGTNIGSANPATVTMNGNHTLLAVFVAITVTPIHTLTVDSMPIQGIPFTIEKVS